MNFLIPRNSIAKVKGSEDMNNLIPSIFDDVFDNFYISTPRRNDMKCDIYEQDNKYHIEMDIPGFDKKDIKIETDNGYLTITASKSEEKNDENKNYLRRERSYGEYQRSFSLNDIDVDNIDAKFEKGMLFITLPKKEIIDNKKVIEIK